MINNRSMRDLPLPRPWDLYLFQRA